MIAKGKLKIRVHTIKGKIRYISLMSGLEG